MFKIDHLILMCIHIPGSYVRGWSIYRVVLFIEDGLFIEGCYLRGPSVETVV